MLEFVGDPQTLKGWIPLGGCQWQSHGGVLKVATRHTLCSALHSGARSGLKDFVVQATLRLPNLEGPGAGVKLGRSAGLNLRGLHVRLNPESQRVEVLTPITGPDRRVLKFRLIKTAPLAVEANKDYQVRVESGATNPGLTVTVNGAVVYKLPKPQRWVPWGCGLTDYGSGAEFTAYRLTVMAPRWPNVAIGDSITHGGHWVRALEKRIGQPIVNAGVGGDSTAGVLARLEPDVIALKPKRCLVFIGTNDLASTLKKEDEGRKVVDPIFLRLRKICEQIQAAGIDVILCNALPRVRRDARRNPTDVYWAVPVYNQLMADYAQAKGFKFVDWHDTIADPAKKDWPLKEYASDLCHPNVKGGERMVQVVPVEWFRD